MDQKVPEIWALQIETGKNEEKGDRTDRSDTSGNENNSKPASLITS